MRVKARWAALDEEDYERAAQLRDQINQLKNNL
jgi:protein-arginine kinase activator protein McsA